MKHSMWILLVVTIFLSVFITGCPKKTPPPPPPPIETPPEPQIEEPVVEPEPEPVLELRTVFFDYDKYNIRSDQQARLTDNAEQLRQFSDVSVMLEGHCDDRGTNEYNMALGAKRSNAIRNFLSEYGIAATRVQTKSYGEERPVCSQSEESCWGRNRRVEFFVIE